MLCQHSQTLLAIAAPVLMRRLKVWSRVFDLVSVAQVMGGGGIW